MTKKQYNPEIFINGYCEIKNSQIVCQLQNGPIKKHGLNGCQIDDVLLLAYKIIHHFNENYPCTENDLCLFHLEEAMNYLTERRKDRESRGVEGKNKP